MMPGIFTLPNKLAKMSSFLHMNICFNHTFMQSLMLKSLVNLPFPQRKIIY